MTEFVNTDKSYSLGLSVASPLCGDVLSKEGSQNEWLKTDVHMSMIQHGFQKWCTDM